MDSFAVGETGQHSYLAVRIVGVAEGIPHPSSESADPRWRSTDEVRALLNEGRIVPLKRPDAARADSASP